MWRLQSASRSPAPSNLLAAHRVKQAPVLVTTAVRTDALATPVAATALGRIEPRDGERFDASDEHRFQEFGSSIGVVLESWWKTSSRRRAAGL